MERFIADLKTFLGLAVPNQCCLDVKKQTGSWFFGGRGARKPYLLKNSLAAKKGVALIKMASMKKL